MSIEVKRKWCGMLAKLVKPSDPVGATQALLDMLPMLDEVPDECFNARTVKHVSIVCKRMPSHGELVSALGDWWKTNRAEFARPALTGPDHDPDFDEMDEFWISFFRTREAEGFSKSPKHATDPRAHVLSLIAANSPRAWSKITGKPIGPRQEPTEEEKRHVSRVLRPMRELVDAEPAQPGGTR